MTLFHAFAHMTRKHVDLRSSTQVAPVAFTHLDQANHVAILDFIRAFYKITHGGRTYKNKVTCMGIVTLFTKHCLWSGCHSVFQVGRKLREAVYFTSRK